MSCIYDDSTCKYYEDGRCDFPSMGSGYPYDAPCFGFDYEDDVIDAQPTIQPKKNKWIRVYLDHVAMGLSPTILCCSKCGRGAIYSTNYCPHCGERMAE